MNLLLHVLSVVVVFVILMRLVRDPWGCAAGALLFGLHPVQVEPVAWVTGMKDVLCGLLSLLALWQYLIYAESARSTIERPGGAKRKRAAVRPTQVKWVHYGLGTVALVLAMLAKPAAVAVPLIVAVFEQRVIKRPWRQWVLTVGAWVAITVPFIILTQWAQPATELTAIPPLWVRPFIAADALAFYLYKLIAPVSLSVDYGRSPDVVQRGWVYFTWIIPFGIAAWIWFTKKEKGWLIAAAAVFTAGLLPVLGFIPFGFQNISTVTDRYLYLAMLGPALLLASFCSRLKTQLSWIAVALILALFGLRSAVQLQVWQNNDSLFQHALSLNPNSWMAELNLGVGLAQRGRADEAIAHYQTALKIRPGYPHALNNLGNTFLAKGRLEEALEYYRQALQSEPDAPDIHFNMASVLMKVNRPEEAVEHLRISLRAEPDSASTHELLGDALLKQNKGEEAAAHYRKALKIEPGSAEAHYKLADILESRGDLDGALGEYLEAVRCQPDYAAAYLNVGIILANRGQLDAATNYFYKALQVRPQFAEAHEMLARALAFQGKMDEAARHYQQAAGNAQ
jgi:tetratricopeptide (TPR) repeat protein